MRDLILITSLIVMGLHLALLLIAVQADSFIVLTMVLISIMNVYDRYYDLNEYYVKWFDKHVDNTN